LARMTPALIVLRTNVKPDMSVSEFVCAPDAAMLARCQTQSVKVPPAKHKLIVSGDINSAVPGLLPTPTLLNVIGVATSESRIPSMNPALLILTEYACEKDPYQAKFPLSIFITPPPVQVKS